MRRILKTKGSVKQWSVRAPSDVHDRLTKFANEQHVSLNYFMVTLLEAGLDGLEKENGTHGSKSKNHKAN